MENKPTEIFPEDNITDKDIEIKENGTYNVRNNGDAIVDVEGGGYPEPTGTIEITENGEGIDVKDYASAEVNVPSYDDIANGTTAQYKALSGTISAGNFVQLNQGQSEMLYVDPSNLREITKAYTENNTNGTGLANAIWLSANKYITLSAYYQGGGMGEDSADITPTVITLADDGTVASTLELATYTGDPKLFDTYDRNIGVSVSENLFCTNATYAFINGTSYTNALILWEINEANQTLSIADAVELGASGSGTYAGVLVKGGDNEVAFIYQKNSAVNVAVATIDTTAKTISLGTAVSADEITNFDGVTCKDGYVYGFTRYVVADNDTKHLYAFAMSMADGSIVLSSAYADATAYTSVGQYTYPCFWDGDKLFMANATNLFDAEITMTQGQPTALTVGYTNASTLSLSSGCYLAVGKKFYYVGSGKLYAVYKVNAGWEKTEATSINFPATIDGVAMRDGTSVITSKNNPFASSKGLMITQQLRNGAAGSDKTLWTIQSSFVIEELAGETTVSLSTTKIDGITASECSTTEAGNVVVLA